MDAARESDLLASDHVARLGARLFSEHLIAVEVAGALLLVALVGAAAIVFQSREMSGGDPRGPGTRRPGQPATAGEGGGDA